MNFFQRLREWIKPSQPQLYRLPQQCAKCGQPLFAKLGDYSDTISIFCETPHCETALEDRGQFIEDMIHGKIEATKKELSR